VGLRAVGDGERSRLLAGRVVRGQDFVSTFVCKSTNLRGSGQVFVRFSHTKKPDEPDLLQHYSQENMDFGYDTSLR
jgi:hypothetical protein